MRGTDKNSKLFLDQLAGRFSFADRVVTMEDLFSTGLIQLVDGVSIGDLDPNNPNNGIEVPTTDPLELPTTPRDLGVASSWGALFLSWDYTAFYGEAGTEIWRNTVNDRDNASLLAVAMGRAYTDNVGEKVTYFYWIRTRNFDGTVSGYNKSNGVQGTSNLKTTAEDFVLDNPDAEFVPFTIANYGTDLAPDWKMLLNGDVIITSDLSIGQLTTGEMRPNSTFTIGNGSIEIGTDTNGKGYMIVTGDGGVVGKDYLYLNAGVLQTYIYDPNIGQHVHYKELRRVERGITSNGTETIIPPYFKSEPIVQLSFEDINVYNPDHNTQHQSLQMNVGPLSEVVGVSGSYAFTPTAVLAVSDGSKVEIEGLDSLPTSNDNWQADSPHTYVDGKRFQTTFTVSSARHYDASNYQNREVLITLQGSLDGGAFSTLASLTVNLSGSGASKQRVLDSGVVTQGTWNLRFIFAASNRDGTEDSGGSNYTYENDNSTTGEMRHLETTPHVTDDSGSVLSDRPVRGAEWKLYEVDYSFSYSYDLKTWRIKIGVSPDTYLKGTADYSIPDGDSDDVVSGGAFDHEAYCLCTEFPNSDPDGTLRTLTGSGTGGTNGKISITEDDPLYLAGKYSASKISINGSNNGQFCPADEYLGAGQAILDITAYDVTYYYRKPITISTTPTNQFKVDSTAADLGAEIISIDDAVINWIAVGE